MAKFMKTAEKAVLTAALTAITLTLAGPRTSWAAEDAGAFKQGMSDYLARKGRVCFEYSWPVYVSPAENPGNSRTALQMPVLEQLGLVHKVDNVPAEETGDAQADKPEGPKDTAGTTYALTDFGQKFYAATGTGPEQANRPRGLCAATLQLDRIVDWKAVPTTGTGDHRRTIVSYTFKIEPESWMLDGKAQQVFPLVARMIQNAGKMQLKETLTLTDRGWQASDQPG
jgi:hypothetical protein